MPKKEVAPVYNRNHTKAWEEEITNIGRHGGNGYKSGKIENSLRNGKEEKAVYNKTLKRWEYL